MTYLDQMDREFCTSLRVNALLTPTVPRYRLRDRAIMRAMTPFLLMGVAMCVYIAIRIAQGG